MDSSPSSLDDELRSVIKLTDITHNYLISWDLKLGEGLSGFVRQCTDKETEEICALKCLPDNKVSRLEIALQLRCNTCPNIVKILDVYKNTIQLPSDEQPKDMLLVVMELMSGGELFDRISRKKRFTEREACIVTKQIGAALQHCHNMNIAHRDLKPENLLLKHHTNNNMLVKLTDFGFAKIDHGNLTTPHFTPYYVSPQILEASKFQKAVKAGTAPEGYTYTYDKSCDMWSLGVILYIMLCGYPPFYSEVPSQLFSKSMEQKILRGEYDFPVREWSRVSHEAKAIVGRLLNVDSDRRMTVDELLNSPWLNDVPLNDQVDLHDTGIIRNPAQLDRFKAGHSATLYDLRVPEKNAELHQVLSACSIEKQRADLMSPNKQKWRTGSKLSEPGWCNPLPGWSNSPASTSVYHPAVVGHVDKKTRNKNEEVFLKLLRDIVGHLLMPQKPNYEEELCVMVKSALRQQTEASSLPRVLEKECWAEESYFSPGKLNHLRLAKSVSDIIQNIQRNRKRVG